MSIFKLIFLQNYRIDQFEKGRNRIFATLAVVLCGKLSFPFLHWNPIGPGMRELFVIWANLISELLFLLTNWLIFFQGPNLKFSVCVGIFRFNWFYSVQWSSDEPENAIIFDMPRYSNSYFFSVTCFVFPSCQSIPVYLRRTIRF